MHEEASMTKKQGLAPKLILSFCFRTALINFILVHCYSFLFPGPCTFGSLLPLPVL